VRLWHLEGCEKSLGWVSGEAAKYVPLEGFKERLS
jgi:hypothetical protein